jgi:hypothetical protein
MTPPESQRGRSARTGLAEAAGEPGYFFSAFASPFAAQGLAAFLSCFF